ncbi:MAG TPA: NAD(P)-binding domain-containing protein [Gillisia sp.]|nr:NAD(P)-binding domain-containing protein [Gillisia sp.]
MNISVLGCGWLGLPLAKELLNNGHIIKGSTTTREKLQALTAEGIIPYEIKLFEEGIQGDISSFLNEAEVLIINIPPGLRKDSTENFIAKIGRLKEKIDRSSIRHLIFVSSTSVFEDRVDMPVYTEDDEPNGTQVNSEQLRGAEKLLFSDNYKTSIIRFGGLFGPGRHPVNFLSGRENVKDPEGPINLIHRDDCIRLINTIIESGLSGIFHGVYPEHPPKEKYYTTIAKKKNLAIPQFDHSIPSNGKIIRSARVEGKLKFTFSKNLMD